MTPTPLGEGKTTTSVGLAQGLRRRGAPAGRGAAAAVDGADVRDQGRCRRRRLQPGRADGADQPAPDRRLPRRHRRPTTCSPRWSTTTCTTATSSASTPAASRGAGCSTSTTASLRNVVDRARRPAWTACRGETGFDITAASEVMVILTLATSLRDLRERLGRIVVGYTTTGEPVTAEDLKAAGRDGGDPRGRHQAQPAADARGQAGARPLRAVRQHRHRQRRRSSPTCIGMPQRRLRWSPRPASAPTWAPSGSST